jgi:hypothetical protein
MGMVGHGRSLLDCRRGGNPPLTQGLETLQPATLITPRTRPPLVAPSSGDLTRCDARHRLKTRCCANVSVRRVVGASASPTRTGRALHARVCIQSEHRRGGASGAADENAAREVVPTVLGAPGTVEIRIANEAQAAVGRDATVTDVDFDVGSVKLATGGSDLSGINAAAPVRAASVRRK